MLSRRRVIAALAGCALPIGGCQSKMGGRSRSNLAAHGVVEPVRFESRGTSLSGDIHLPADSPAIGVVVVHGSGPEPRSTDLARRFAADGVAVLTYDKRGVGESGGKYEGTYNISWENLHLLADDAVAAVQALAAHPRLRGRKIGMFGVSQAGWIIPIAASRDRRIGFFALWSGPVCRVSDELEYGISSAKTIAAESSAATREGSAPYPVEQIRSYIAEIRAEGTDVDPRTSLRKLDIPGLWLFGGQDHQMPTALSSRQLAEMIEEGKVNFEQRTLPGAAHAMQGASEEAYRLTIEWFRARV